MKILILILILLHTVSAIIQPIYFSDNPYIEQSGARNVCQQSAYADNEDMQNLQLITACQNFCNSFFNQKNSECQVNPQGDTSGYHACIQADTNNVKYGQLTPETAERILYSNNFYAGVPSNKTWSISKGFTQTLSQSTTSSVGFSVGVSFSVNIPVEEIDMAFGAASQFTFKSSSTQTQTSTSTVLFDDTTSIQAAQNCSYTFDLSSSTQSYNSPWTVPICIDGISRCQFPSPVSNPQDPGQGSHYYWYFDITAYAPSLDDRCSPQKGLMQANLLNSTSMSCVTSPCGSKQCHFVDGNQVNVTQF